jgi:hypothetical protein
VFRNFGEGLIDLWPLIVAITLRVMSPPIGVRFTIGCHLPRGIEEFENYG